jgi:hypothetical protein
VGGGGWGEAKGDGEGLGSDEVPGDVAGGNGDGRTPMGIAEGATGETAIVCGEGEPAPPHPGKAIAAKANKPVTHRFKPKAGLLIYRLQDADTAEPGIGKKSQAAPLHGHRQHANGLTNRQ